MYFYYWGKRMEVMLILEERGGFIGGEFCDEDGSIYFFF